MPLFKPKPKKNLQEVRAQPRSCIFLLTPTLPYCFSDLFCSPQSKPRLSPGPKPPKTLTKLRDPISPPVASPRGARTLRLCRWKKRRNTRRQQKGRVQRLHPAAWGCPQPLALVPRPLSLPGVAAGGARLPFVRVLEAWEASRSSPSTPGAFVESESGVTSPPHPHL